MAPYSSAPQEPTYLEHQACLQLRNSDALGLISRSELGSVQEAIVTLPALHGRSWTRLTVVPKEQWPPAGRGADRGITTRLLEKRQRNLQKEIGPWEEVNRTVNPSLCFVG